MLDLWYRALHAPIGIEVSCSDVEKVRQRLYALRREVQDRDLDKISLCQSPFAADRLWLIKRPKNAP